FIECEPLGTHKLHNTASTRTVEERLLYLAARGTRELSVDDLLGMTALGEDRLQREVLRAKSERTSASARPLPLDLSAQAPPIERLVVRKAEVSDPNFNEMKDTVAELHPAILDLLDHFSSENRDEPPGIMFVANNSPREMVTDLEAPRSFGRVAAEVDG